MNGDVRGINPQQFSQLRADIKLYYRDDVAGIKESLENGLVKPISEYWYTQEGVTYFESVAQMVQNASKQICEIYNNFVKALNEAGRVWAENTKNEIDTIPEVEEWEINLDVSPIQATRADGAVVIDIDGATSVANGLVEVQNQILEKTKNIHAALDASTSFIGGGQSEAISEVYNAVCNVISSIFEFLADETSGVKANINLAVQKQRETAEGIASQFNSAASGQ